MAARNLNLHSSIKMHNGIPMPRLGLGVYQSPVKVCVNSCLTAVKAGYRHIDTAQYYRNERQVGQSVDQSGHKRTDLFVTTKMLHAGRSIDDTFEEIKRSAALTGGSSGYADLFLIHTSFMGSNGRKTLWLALEKAVNEGVVKSIGVSNFGIGHIEEMKSYATIWPPHVNQIELHPWCQQREIVEYCQRNGIVVQAYCPLVRNTKASDETLNSIATKHKKSTGQILIRYCLQKDWVPLPKSDNPDRIRGNAEVFDFELDAEDMKNLDAKDQGARGAIVESVIND